MFIVLKNNIALSDAITYELHHKKILSLGVPAGKTHTFQLSYRD